MVSIAISDRLYGLLTGINVNKNNNNNKTKTIMKKKNLFTRMLLLLALIVGTSSAWATGVTYKLTIDGNDFNTTSYAANNNEKTSNAVCTTDNTKTYQVKWTSYQVMKNGDNMQWQKSKGSIYNSTDLGTIKSVTVSSSAGSFTTYYGTSAQPSSGTTVGNGFFQIIVGNATGTTSKVEITFEVPDLTPSNLAITNASTALTFDLFNNSSAQTINYTTSGSGAVTVSESNYVSTSVDAVNKTITVTPVAVTPSAQTITVSQAADDTYAAGSVTFTVSIEDSTPDPYTWEETSISDLTSSDVFVIVGTNNGTYAMTNDNGTVSAPTASSITISDGKISGKVANNIKWNISGNSTNGYTFYPNGVTDKYLYCNTEATSSSNNNMRVGTGDRKVFQLTSSNYLVTKDSYTARYVSVYADGPDWRGYTS